jgi:hypothetical protein
MAINPAVVLPSEAGGFRDIGAGDQAYRPDLPAGGPSDNFFDEEADMRNRQIPDIVENFGPDE